MVKRRQRGGHISITSGNRRCDFSKKTEIFTLWSEERIFDRDVKWCESLDTDFAGDSRVAWVATSVAVVAVVCLNTGSAAHATAPLNVSKVSAVSAQGGAVAVT